MLDDSPDGGLPESTDPPIFEINYTRLKNTSKKIGGAHALRLIKEAYLTGNIDPRIKRVLLRIEPGVRK